MLMLKRITTFRLPSWMKSSFLNSMGIAAARFMGIAFSFMLANAYSTSDFGYVTYVLSLANLVAIVTQPFGQHVLPFLIGKYRKDTEQFQAMMNNAWAIVLILFGVSFVVATGVLLALDRFSWELMAVFFGITIFYSYHGLSTGFLSTWHFLAAYLGSNFVQLVLVAIVVYGFKIDSVVPSIFIYGLSYLLPLGILMIFFPLPLKIRLSFNPEMIRRLLRIFTPIVSSHGLYVLHYSADVILLEYFSNESAVGIYGLTKTLTSAFSFIPGGIALMLLPQIANPDTKDPFRIVMRSVLFATAVNLVGAVFFLGLYKWVVTTFFGEEYYIGIDFAFVMVAQSILVSIHGLSFAGLAGTEKTYIDTLSRFIMVVGIFILGTLLIPDHESKGAAWAVLLSVMAGLSVHATYVLRLLMRRNAKTQSV
jgi:O-antigen/teichoic acid export membrane protein